VRSAVGCHCYWAHQLALFEVYGYVRVVERIIMVILYVLISGRINVFV
jgi:hypothetical protein